MINALPGWNLSTPEEVRKIVELGLTSQKCPGIIASAVALLEVFL